MARATSAPRRVTPSRLWRISPRVRQDGPPAAGSPRTARSQLPHPPDRLLRRVRRRRPALRPARRARRRLADPGGREQGAQARARPLRLGRRHLPRQGPAQGHAQGPRRAARAEHPAAGQAARAGPARRPDRAQQPARAGRQPPGVRARHRAGPQPVVHAGHDRPGHVVGRERQPGRGQRRGARRQGHLGVARDVDRHARHRSHDADRRDGEREPGQGDRAGRGGPPDRPRARLAVGQGRRPARGDRRDLRHRVEGRQVPLALSPRHPDRPRDARRRRRAATTSRSTSRRSSTGGASTSSRC